MAGEYRLALFIKSRDAFAAVGGMLGDALQIPLQIQLGIEAVAKGGFEGLLHQAESSGGLAGQAPGDARNFRHERRIVHAFPDEAPLRRLFRVRRR